LKGSLKTQIYPHPPTGGFLFRLFLLPRHCLYQKKQLPKENQRSLGEVPEEVKKGLRFHFVKSVDEALEIAFCAVAAV